MHSTLYNRIRIHRCMQANKTIIWLSYLLEDFTGVEQQKIPLFCDNQGAVRLAYNAEFHQRTKHVLVKYHYMRKKISEHARKISCTCHPTTNLLISSPKPSPAQYSLS